MTFTAQVAGHICLDLTPELEHEPDLTAGALNATGLLAIAAGGCVANTGLTLRGLGASVLLIADIGEDPFGALLQGVLSPVSDAVALNQVPGASTSYSLVLQPPGRDRVFFHHVGANAQFDGTRIDPAAADLLHLGYPPLLPALSANGGDPLMHLLERARDNGTTTSMDMAFVDPHSAAARVDWSRLLARCLPLTDVFTPSVDDLFSATGVIIEPSPDGLMAAAADLVHSGAAAVMLTAGSAGMALVTGSAERLRDSQVMATVADEWADQSVWAPALRGPALRTTGAGDAASAGLLYALLSGLGPEIALACAAHTAAVRVRGDTDFTRVLRDVLATDLNTADRVSTRT